MRDNVRLERRWNERHELDCAITIYNGGRELLQTTIKNISLGGFIIDTNPYLFDSSQQFIIGLSLKNHGGTSQHSLPARLIRTTTQEAAFIFTGYTPETVHLLREIFDEHSPLSHQTA